MNIEVEKFIEEYEVNNRVYQKIVIIFYKPETKTKEREEIDRIEITHTDLHSVLKD